MRVALFTNSEEDLKFLQDQSTWGVCRGTTFLYLGGSGVMGTWQKAILFSGVKALNDRREL